MSAAATSSITRDEFESLGARLTALEQATTDTEPVRSNTVPPHAHNDYVRHEEFRLFKWLGTFALAAILGGFGLIYEQTSDLRVAMERLHSDLLQAMHVQHASIRSDIGAVRERVVRLETAGGIESR